tara:strand:+ start:283 stop:753 length:471 start_codon:yes stop_codon:yes gene_type:complete
MSATTNAAQRNKALAAIAAQREAASNGGGRDFAANRLNANDVIGHAKTQSGPPDKTIEGNPTFIAQFQAGYVADRVMVRIGDKEHTPFKNELAKALGLDKPNAEPSDIQFGVDYILTFSLEHTVARTELKDAAGNITQYSRQASAKLLPGGTCIAS